LLPPQFRSTEKSSLKVLIKFAKGSKMLCPLI
jgi:hypothetical protein